jgi:plastocyanin
VDPNTERLGRRALLRRAAVLALGGTALVVLDACGAGPRPAPGGMAPPPAPLVDMAPGDYFFPYVRTLRLGETVTFRNSSSDTHSVVSLPPSPAPVRLVVPPGQSRAWRPPQAGVYRYYCSYHDTYDPRRDVVLSDRASNRSYPAAMHGVLVVSGPGFSPAPQAEATVRATDEDLFQPYLAVIRRGGRVTWHNTAGVQHAVQTRPAAQATLNLMLTPGATASEVFRQSGVYPYFCQVHARWDTRLGQAVAMPNARAYPAAMAGLVVVT